MVTDSATPVTVLELASSVVRRWRLVLGLPLFLAVLAYAASFLAEPKYRATISFSPETQSGGALPASLIGLGSQFGVDFGGNSNRSSRFYVDVAMSRRVLEGILNTRYADPDSPADSLPLIELIDLEMANTARRAEASVRVLRRSIGIVYNAQTDIIDLTVTHRAPDLAAAIANEFVPLLDLFNRTTVRSQARERRQFVEGRLQETLQQLQNAEATLQRWLENNRQFENSPELRLVYNRLTREIQLREEVHVTLAREHERARIDEFNDLSLITVVTPAIPPTLPSSPRRALWALVSFVLGSMVAFGIVVFQEFLKRLRQDYPPSYEELTDALRSARRDLIPFSRRRLPQSK